MIKRFTRTTGVYTFDPPLRDSLKRAIEDELRNISGTSGVLNQTTKEIIELLGNVDSTDETNLIIAYEILYNISIGRTTFADVSEYLNNENQSVSFESLEQYIEANCDSGSATSIKETILWKLLYGKTVLDAEYTFNGIDWNWNGDESIWDNISKLSNAFNISISINNYGNMMSYIKERNYFMPKILKEDGTDDFFEEDITKFMVSPIYSAGGELGTYKNERYATEAYYQKLNNLKPEIVAELTPTFNNDIFSSMWTIITNDYEYPSGFSNNRKFNSGSLLKMPSIRTAVYDSTTYNDFLHQILNAPFNKTSFDPYMGYEPVMEQLALYVKRLIINLDERNAKIKEGISIMTSKISNYMTTLGNAAIQSKIDGLSSSEPTMYTIDGVEMSAAEAVEYCKSQIGNINTLIDKLKGTIYTWYNRDTSKGLLYRQTFIELYTEAFNDKSIGSLRQWYSKQFYYSLAEFFSYDTSSEKDFMNGVYSDMKKFSTAIKALLAKLSK